SNDEIRHGIRGVEAFDRGHEAVVRAKASIEERRGLREARRGHSRDDERSERRCRNHGRGEPDRRPRVQSRDERDDYCEAERDDDGCCGMTAGGDRRHPRAIALELAPQPIATILLATGRRHAVSSDRYRSRTSPRAPRRIAPTMAASPSATPTTGAESPPVAN